MKKYCLPPLIYRLLLFVSIPSCNPPNKSDNAEESETEQKPAPKEVITGSVFGAVTTEIDDNIRSIFQNKAGIYWFGTNAAGVYRYDPKQAGTKALTQFTVKDGLANDQIQSIQEDNAGTLWFGTGRFGVFRYDGKTIVNFNEKEGLGRIMREAWLKTKRAIYGLP
ncbi:two-component regulator propeller domain-containing protein [Runella slithyformis]|uniref:two-component regulator propeller domain-containing protein n=1 Tax=Runella slithyformis TaxID=106 RepID=UPI00030E1E6C|nr:two-component regulator propeller domain-containing protein [Runella slithyformis]